ncbi:MAG: 1-acyl-sn-glycerol-3-phosphate acyltransferase [Alphaproteobacteria bacterium]|nr:1-acyl-sn-glycerol-3-phosphate acyltransferase [Alphaproteobacteria bacterium]
MSGVVTEPDVQSAAVQGAGLQGTGRVRNLPVYVDAEDERRLLDLDGGLIHSQTRATVRLVLYITFTLLLIPVQAVAVLLRSEIAVRLPRIYHRWCLRILGVRLEIVGRPSRVRPTLFVSNHVSYLDISVLGASVHGSFIAKEEVSGWPGFGLLAKLQRSVFIRRERGQVGKQSDEIGDRLEAGDSLILFPEGTSGDGNRVLPFKSALFQVANREVRGSALTVQPVSVTYTRLNGVPIGRALRPFYAWYGDMDLAPHLWHLAGLGQLTVVVEFHPPTNLPEMGSRKNLATYARGHIASGVARANAGRTG